MANSIKISRKRPASEGGGNLEQHFQSIPDGATIDILVNGAPVAGSPFDGDVEIRYTLEQPGGMRAQGAQTVADKTSATAGNFKSRTEQTGGLSGT